MSLKNGFFALALMLIGLPAFANRSIETCSLDGKIAITEDTTFVCNQPVDFSVKAELVSNGYTVIIKSDRCIASDGMKFTAFEGDVTNAPNGKDAGMLRFEAECMTGTAESIHNDGYKNGAGGPVVYAVLTLDGANGPYKNCDISEAGVGQGQDGGVFLPSGPIDLKEFKTRMQCDI